MTITPVQAAEHRYRINRILSDHRMTQRGRFLQLWNYVLSHELHSGSQFLVTKPDGAPYIVVGDINEIMQLPRAGRGGDRWHAHFTQKYGLLEHETEARFVYDALRAYVLTTGARVELRRFAAYDREARTVYLSGYNGRMWRLDGTEIVQLSSGEDGIFFADDDEGLPITPDIADHGGILERLVDLNFAPSGLSGISPAQQKMAMLVWIFALALPDLMPTKPLLLLEGLAGSGKTSAIQGVQLALMGAERTMTLKKSNEDDFGVLLLRSPIALFDNTDSYIEWVPDAIAAYTTGGKFHKRRLYADDEMHTIRPHAFIAVASRNPSSFRREDVADRCLILRLERRPDFMPMEAWKAQILADRARLLGEYLFYLNRIIAQLRADAESGDVVENETYRMADFAAIARVVGKVMSWDAADIKGMMMALQGERDAFVNEEDPLRDMLAMWIAYRPRNGPANVGRLVDAQTLCTELENFAQAKQIPWKHTMRTLAQKIRSPHIESEFRIETNVVNGHRVFQIWRHTDARLEVVG